MRKRSNEHAEEENQLGLRFCSKVLAMAMATMATPDVLRSSHAYVLAPSLSLTGANVSPNPSASCRTNSRPIRSRIVHVASSLPDAPAFGASSSIRVFSSHSSVVWNPLPSQRFSSSSFSLRAKKVAEIEVIVDKAAEPEEEEEEVEISWVQEKAEDLVIATGNAIDRVPGPRVGESRMPWLVALPLAYLGISFVLSVVKTYTKYTSPKGQRKRQVGIRVTTFGQFAEIFSSMASDSLARYAVRRKNKTVSSIYYVSNWSTLDFETPGNAVWINFCHLFICQKATTCLMRS